MLRPNLGVSWDFHHRRTKFFISHVWSPPKNILCPVTFFGTKIPMLSAPFIDGSPYLFYAKNICHLYSLLAPIRTIVNSILSGWATRIPIFFAIAVTGHRIFLGGLHTLEMKNFVRRWWKSHDTPEFGRSIVAGTMRRMHMVSKRKGMPICDYYVADGAWNILY